MPGKEKRHQQKRRKCPFVLHSLLFGEQAWVHYSKQAHIEILIISPSKDIPGIEADRFVRAASCESPESHRSKGKGELQRSARLRGFHQVTLATDQLTSPHITLAATHGPWTLLVAWIECLVRKQRAAGIFRK